MSNKKYIDRNPGRAAGCVPCWYYNCQLSMSIPASSSEQNEINPSIGRWTIFFLFKRNNKQRLLIYVYIRILIYPLCSVNTTTKLIRIHNYCLSVVLWLLLFCYSLRRKTNNYKYSLNPPFSVVLSTKDFLT